MSKNGGNGGKGSGGNGAKGGGGNGGSGKGPAGLPSTTGNRSGGGRTNLPPKAGG